MLFLFAKVKNYQYFAADIFSHEKCDFFWHFCPKNWKGWPDNFETFHKEKSGVLEKTPRKRKFYGSSPLLRFMIFEKKKTILLKTPKCTALVGLEAKAEA